MVKKVGFLLFFVLTKARADVIIYPESGRTEFPGRQQVFNKKEREAVPLYYSESKAQIRACVSRFHRG